MMRQKTKHKECSGTWKLKQSKSSNVNAALQKYKNDNNDGDDRKTLYIQLNLLF